MTLGVTGQGVDFVVNGTPVTVRGAHPHLLSALREELNITSPKDGCSPSGQCGCCTVLVNGKAVVSCQTDLGKVAGGTVTTLEGFNPEVRDRFAQAFAACGGLQCGFCIPGIVVRAHSQIEKKGSSLTRSDMARHLGAHLCRCTGYTKILDAIEAVAVQSSPQPLPLGEIGTRSAKYEAAELALGDRGYVDDIRLPGLLHAALVFTDHARADILKIDTEKAMQQAGVVAVYTAQDIPGDPMVGIWPAAHMLYMRRSLHSGSSTRFSNPSHHSLSSILNKVPSTSTQAAKASGTIGTTLRAYSALATTK
ncbi:MAG: hypothetical protein EBZ55_04600 [Actinobacteria bacterium]|nr:hypothetical protein [Actinomycetota bacterium]